MEGKCAKCLGIVGGASVGAATIRGIGAGSGIAALVSQRARDLTAPAEMPSPPIVGAPERKFALRQADQARTDFGVVLDELSFVEEQLARLPTRAQIGRIALKATFGVLAALAAIALLLLR